MTEASMRKHLDHHDWLVTCDDITSPFSTLRQAATFMRRQLIAGKKLVMLSMQPRK